MLIPHSSLVSLSIKKNKRRVGRGPGSSKGKTCGRGVKGQKSRSGVSLSGFEGGQNSLLTKLPKRGFVSISKKIFEIVNIEDIERAVKVKKIKESDIITKELLYLSGLLCKKKLKVKLLANGSISVALKFSLDSYSKAAKNAILEAKGEII